MAILNHSHVNLPINLICMQPWYWCPLDSLHRMPRLITLPCNNSVFCTPRLTYIMAHEDTPFIYQGSTPSKTGTIVRCHCFRLRKMSGTVIASQKQNNRKRQGLTQGVRRFGEVPVLDRKLTVRRQFKHGKKSKSKRMSGKHRGKRVND